MYLMAFQVLRRLCSRSDTSRFALYCNLGVTRRYAKLVSLRGKEDQHRETTIETIRQITEVLIQGDKARDPASQDAGPRVRRLGL